MIAISVVSSSCVSTHAGATEADTASTPESPWSEYPFSAPPSRREESLGISSRARKSVGKERNCVSGSAGGGTVGEGKWCFHDELRVSPLLKSVPVGVLPLPQGREGRRSVPREPFCARHGRRNASPPSPFSRRPSPSPTLSRRWRDREAKMRRRRMRVGGRVEMINHEANLQNEAMKGIIRPMRLHSAARGSSDAVSPVPIPCPLAALDAPSFGALMNLLRFCPPFPALVPGPQ